MKTVELGLVLFTGIVAESIPISLELVWVLLLLVVSTFVDKFFLVWMRRLTVEPI